jgi:hypothetical protein
MILTYHGFTPTYLKFEPPFVVIDAKGGEVINKESVIGGANK